MSGIYGYFSTLSENNTDINKIYAWNKAYGIKNETVKEKNYGMGCCLDLLSNKSTPDRCVICNDTYSSVFDALIYNRNELIKKYDLQESLSDEDIIFFIVTRSGLEDLKYINGDFCGAVYNVKKNELILFRDHMGVRPLFYYYDGLRVLFSTDIRGIISQSSLNLELDEKSLFIDCKGYSKITRERTEFKNIHMVRSSNYIVFKLTLDKITMSSYPYWKFATRKVRFSSEEKYYNELRRLIEDSVKRRLDVLDDPVGSELSGGLDSSVISILINRFGRKCFYFSWSKSPEEKPFVDNDERYKIKDICDREGISCMYTRLGEGLDDESIIAEKTRAIGIGTEESAEGLFMKYALPSYINTTLISITAQALRRKGSRVVFSGHGGDEGVSHRSRPYEMLNYHEYYRYFRYMFSLTHGKKHRIIRTIKNCRSEIKEARVKLREAAVFKESEYEILNRDFTERMKNEHFLSHMFTYSPKEYIENGGSENRLYNTAIQGAYSDVRYIFPYLDYRVVDYALSIPRYLYLKGWMNRYTFRSAFKDILPESVYREKSKKDLSWINSQGGEEPDFSALSEYYRQRKADIVKGLSRDYWDKYLDFERIDKWVKRTYTSQQEIDIDSEIADFLGHCVLIENMVRKSQAVSSNV